MAELLECLWKWGTRFRRHALESCTGRCPAPNCGKAQEISEILERKRRETDGHTLRTKLKTVAAISCCLLVTGPMGEISCQLKSPVCDDHHRYCHFFFPLLNLNFVSSHGQQC